MKQTDNEIDALFERLSPETAHEIDCQGVPTLRKRIKTFFIRKKIIKYSEPSEYIPKSIRKKYKLGEYSEKN